MNCPSPSPSPLSPPLVPGPWQVKHMDMTMKDKKSMWKEKHEERNYAETSALRRIANRIKEFPELSLRGFGNFLYRPPIWSMSIKKHAKERY